jgi:serine/threonine-protein kinase
MSPEQCSGNRLDARSDVYSIGVIAYQMLSGDTPFKGDFSKVMEAHKVLPPPPLTAKKVRK